MKTMKIVRRAALSGVLGLAGAAGITTVTASTASAAPACVWPNWPVAFEMCADPLEAAALVLGAPDHSPNPCPPPQVCPTGTFLGYYTNVDTGTTYLVWKGASGNIYAFKMQS